MSACSSSESWARFFSAFLIPPRIGGGRCLHNPLAVESHRLLQGESTLHFVGNVEGREIIRGACDVLVCDGFSGNLLLKFYESVAGFVIGLLKRKVEHSQVDLDLEEVFRVLDYSEIGGAPLLGVNGISPIVRVPPVEETMLSTACLIASKSRPRLLSTAPSPTRKPVSWNARRACS